MSFLKSKAAKVIAIILAIFIILGFSKDFIIKSVATVGASQVLGTKVSIGQFSIGVFKSSIRIKDFKIYQPPGYPEGVFVDIPEVSIDYSLGEMLKRKLYFPLIVFNLQEVNLIKNKEGVLNVDALKVVPKGKEEQKPAEEKKEPSKSAPMMPLKIDVLKLNVRKVIFKDYSKGEKPVVQVYDVKIKDKTFENITSAGELVTDVMIEIISQSVGASLLKGAQIYGAAALLGAGLLPVGVVSAFAGKDTTEADFQKSFDVVYKASLATINELGELLSENRQEGSIVAKVEGGKVEIQIQQTDPSKTNVKIKARKLMMPNLQIAEAVLHEMTQKLK